MQLDGHDFADGAAFGGQRRLDLLEFLQFIRRPVIEHRADLILAPHRRPEEPEAHRLPDDEAELLRGQLGVGAFLHARSARVRRR